MKKRTLYIITILVAALLLLGGVTLWHCRIQIAQRMALREYRGGDNQKAWKLCAKVVDWRNAGAKRFNLDDAADREFVDAFTFGTLISASAGEFLAYPESADLFDPLLRLLPDDEAGIKKKTELCVDLGIVVLQNGDFKSARQLLERAYAINISMNYDSTMYLVDLCMATGDYNRATEILNEMVENSGNAEPEFQAQIPFYAGLKRGEIAMRKGEWEKANRYFKSTPKPLVGTDYQILYFNEMRKKASYKSVPFSEAVKFFDKIASLAKDEPIKDAVFACRAIPYYWAGKYEIPSKLSEKPEIDDKLLEVFCIFMRLSSKHKLGHDISGKDLEYLEARLNAMNSYSKIRFAQRFDIDYTTISAFCQNLHK